MSSNKIIAQNSLILYFRLIVTTIIGLFASRVVLLELGADNFGLYTVVGGVVAMLNVLNTTMISTSNRYIAIEIGKGKVSQINTVFNTLLAVHFFFGLILIALVEIVGVWYVTNYLNIPSANVSDALFVLHLSVASSFLSTVIIPYQGLVTAYERFNVKAIIEIINSILNLGVVMLLVFSAGNKLILYASFVLLVQFIVSLSYFFYCQYNYRNDVKFKLNWNRSDYLEISKFFGWQLVYVGGSIGTSQGGAVIINLFFGTVLNAAFGIASRVNEFVFAFVKNLNQAALPQIMKSYSGGDTNRSLALIYSLTRYTYFIMLLPAVPILLSIDTILVLWLKVVPPYTAAFVIFRIIHGLVSCFESGFDGLIDASGRIKNTKLFYSILFPSMLPIVYMLYKYQFPPYSITVVMIVAEIVFLLFQAKVLSTITEFRPDLYFRESIFPSILVTISLFPLWFIKSLFGDGFVSLISFSLLALFLTAILIFFIGLNLKEKQLILTAISKIPGLNIFFK